MFNCYAVTAYKAYCVATGGKSLISGQTLPDWKDLRPDIQKAWYAAAEAVYDELEESRKYDTCECSACS